MLSLRSIWRGVDVYVGSAVLPVHARSFETKVSQDDSGVGVFQTDPLPILRLRGLGIDLDSRSAEAKMQDPCACSRVAIHLSGSKLPLLCRLHGLAGKIFTRPRGNERGSLHVARGVDGDFYSNPDRAGDGILRRLR